VLTARRVATPTISETANRVPDTIEISMRQILPHRFPRLPRGLMARNNALTSTSQARLGTSMKTALPRTTVPASSVD
jgi:hypothetical protein